MKRLLVVLSVAGCLSAFSQEPKTAEVKDFNGIPGLFVNDKHVTPDFYALTHAYGARWSWEEVPQRNLNNFCKLGISLFQLDLYFEDLWYKDSDSLDIAKAQRQIRGLLDVCPDAAVVIRIHVNAPFWWNEENRDECTHYSDGPIDQRNYGPPYNNEDGDVDRPLRASLASMKWRLESGQKLAEFCRRTAATREGKSVIGIHVSGGVYGEWHYWGFINHDPDIGMAMTNYFKSWLRNKYKSNDELQKSWRSKDVTFDKVSVPTSAERNMTTDSIFRDPLYERRIIDYFTAQQQVVAEDIEYFCKIVKDNWPRKVIVGVFYGYFHMTFCRQASGGHLFIERILNCPYIDYLAAPQSYWDPTKNAGGSGNSRGVIESARLHGKLWLDEVDNGYLANPPAGDPARSYGRYDPHYDPVICRSTAYPLMRGAGLWYYDFGPRESFGWWDNPIYLNEIKAIKELFDNRLDTPFRSSADVLFVWDQDVFYYVKNGWSPVCYDQIDKAMEEALHAGATIDHIYLFDLDKIDLKQYRAVVFMNTYLMTKKQKDTILTRVASDKRTVIFNYLPGYTDGKRNSLEFVEGITTLKVKKYNSLQIPLIHVLDPEFSYSMDGPVYPMCTIVQPGVKTMAVLNDGSVIMAERNTKDSRIVFSTLPIHGTALFRKLFADAGCHIYNFSDDFTYANNGLIMIHTKEGGGRKIFLSNGNFVNVDLKPYSTTILDAQSGEMLFE